jgi:DNA-directed RNA polymerase sigma subunit (sigma70/sigma32)
MSTPEAPSPRIPPRLIERVNRLVRTSQRMLLELGHRPTAEELADRLGMPLGTVEKLLKIATTSTEA